MDTPKSESQTVSDAEIQSGTGAMLEKAITKAVSIQQPAVDAYIARVRRSRPSATPEDVIRGLSKYYLATVSTTGGAAGAASIVPGAGIPAALLDLAAFHGGSQRCTPSPWRRFTGYQ